MVFLIVMATMTPDQHCTTKVAAQTASQVVLQQDYFILNYDSTGLDAPKPWHGASEGCTGSHASAIVVSLCCYRIQGCNLLSVAVDGSKPWLTETSNFIRG